MEPKKVLYVAGRMHYGGLETMLMNFMRHIDKNKIQIDFMLNYQEPGIFDDEIRKLGGKIYIMPRLFVKNVFRYIKAVNQFFKEHKEYQVVHGHLTSVGVIYLTIAKLHGVKTTIIHAHTTSVQSSVKGMLERFIMKPLKFCADYYFACSTEAAIHCFGKGILKKTNYKMIKNGVVVEKFVFNPSIREKKRIVLNVEDKFVIGHIGRFCEEKNHLFLIDIFQVVYHKNKNAVLVLLGDGPLMHDVKDKVQAYHLEDAVIFLGTRSDIHEMMQAMDVFVLPSLHEGLPVVSAEAQTAGLHCIFSDTITKEADITGMCKFISLQEPFDVWANELLSCQGLPRENQSDKIKAAGYDVADQAKWLEQFYLDSYEERRY